METTLDFIDAVKKRLNITSDYALAPILGVSRGAISRYRCKHDLIGEETAYKVAELLDLQPGYVLACVAAERTKLAHIRKAWMDAAKKMSAAIITVFIGSFALSSALPGAAHAAAQAYQCILCKIRRAVGFLALLALFAAIPAQAADSWDSGEIVGEGIYFALHTVDWGQTRAIAKKPTRYYEAVNPILGRHPSVGRVDTWFLTMAITQPLIAHALPHPWRRLWIASGAFFEWDMVNRNAALGLRMAW